MESRPESRTSPVRRPLWALLLVPCGLFVGLVGGLVAGRFLGTGSGFDALADMLGYGMAGALAGLVLAVVAVWKAPPRALRTAALAALAACLLLAGLGAWGAWRARAERRAGLGLDAPLPPASRLSVEATTDEAEGVRSFRRLEVDGETWRQQWTAVGPEAAECTARLTAADAEALLAAVDAAEARTAEAPPPCQGAAEPATTVTWRPPSGERPRRLAIDSACRSAEPALADLVHRLHRLPIDAVDRGEAECR